MLSQTARIAIHQLSGCNTFTDCQEAILTQTVSGKTCTNCAHVVRQHLYKLSGGGKHSQTVMKQNLHNLPGGKTFTNCKGVIKHKLSRDKALQTYRRQNAHKLVGGKTFTNCQKATPSQKPGGGVTFTNCQEAKHPQRVVRRKYLNQLSESITFTSF